MIITPRMSEKAYKSAQAGTYVFNVPKDASKQQIIAMVEAEHGVKVVDARMSVHKGKAVAASRGKRRSPGIAHRKDTKKAYVRLADGATLDLFNEAKEEKK